MVSLYFHIPFCSKKCPYCHFYVLPDKADLHQLLLEALYLQWKKWEPEIQGKKIVSIYFGGGTPSLLGPKAIEKILSWVPYSSPCEITLEANPEKSFLPEFVSVGVNRVSLGVQSLDNPTLTMLGRTHTAERAIETIANAGIENISIDLMYEIPGQTLESWKKTLARLKDLPITHLSLYNLTFEPQTLFFKKQKELTPLLPSSELSLEMLQLAVSHLESIGLKRYEISAFAKEGFHSCHNTGYWTGRPFLGLGPSAFSYWNGKRFRNVANLQKYAAALKRGASPIDFEEQLPYPQNIQELLAIRLRLLEGVDLKDYPVPPVSLQNLQGLQDRGWLQIRGSRAKLTPEGLLFYDSVAEAIV